MSEGELGQIKPKKGLLGNERVELTKEQFDEFKGLIYQSRNLIHQKELEVQQAKSQILSEPLKTVLRRVCNGLRIKLKEKA